MQGNDPLDVRCLPYMPLQIERLRKSKAWLRCKRRPELAFYLVNLWMRAWHEVPAGTIEDDDDVLADAAMCEPSMWPQIKDDLLKGWKRSGNRLSHETVTELATEAAGKLRKNKNRTEAARAAALKKASDPSVTETVTELATEPVTELVTGPEGKGREEKIKEEANASSKKGFRIPEDWAPSEALIGWARQRGIASDPEVIQLAEGYRDYWLVETGQRARKLDWDRAFQTWVRNELKRRRPRQPARQANGELPNSILFGRG